MQITNSSAERISNIQKFTGIDNVSKVLTEGAEAMLGLEDACRELEANENKRQKRQDSYPKLAKPRFVFSLAAAPGEAELAANKARSEAPQENAVQQQANSPTNDQANFNSGAALTGIMANVRKILGDGKIENLKANLKNISEQSGALRHKANELMDKLDSQIAQLNALKQKYEELRSHLQESQGDRDKLSEQKGSMDVALADNAKTRAALNKALAEAKAALDALPTPAPGSADQPQYDKQKALVARLERDVASANQEGVSLKERQSELIGLLSLADTKVQSAKTTLVAAAKDITTESTKTQNIRKEISEFIDNAPIKFEVDGERFENALTMLAFVTAMLKKLLNEDAIKGMEREQAVMEEISKATRKDSEKKAKEAEEAQRKADEASKAASCASKIFGAIMTAIAVVATVVTMGAASPLMAVVAVVSLALTVTEFALEASGQSTLMQRLANEISSVIEPMLISFGVSKEKAKFAANIVGQVIAAVAFIAVSFVSVGSAAKNSVMSGVNIAKSAIASAIKVLPARLLSFVVRIGGKIKSAATTVTKGIGKAVKQASGKIKNHNVAVRRTEIGLKAAGITTAVTNMATTGGLNLYAAEQTKQLKELLAGLTLNSEVLAALDELLKSLVKALTKQVTLLDKLFEETMTSMKESADRNLRSFKRSLA